ncbi:MAG: hypothetical protein U7123_04390 [Potamolinea sp.]
MKNKSLFGLMVSLVVLGVGSLSVQAQNRPTPSNMTTQPQVPTWRQFVDRGGGRYIQVDYDLPNEYRDGFVYFNQGPSVINAFILNQGLSSYTSLASDIQIDFQVAEKYVKSGQAIQFSWNLGNSGLRYANDTEVRFPSRGTGCFRANCLTAPFLNNAQISRILLSKRRITQSSQTATGQSTNTRQQDTTNSFAQSSREVQFQVCSESQTWVRPNEAEQEARLNSLSRYANREYRQSKFWTDNIFLFTSYGLAARHEPVYISGLWKIGDEALKCYQSEGITQKINSGQIAEIWLLQHKVKKIEWQNGRYVMVVAPVQKGAQFINFSRVERQYPLNIKVVSENGTELANLTAPGSPVVTALLPNRNQQTTTGRSLSPVQTYRDTRALGMAQFLQGKQELISAQEKLQRTVQGKYDIVEIPKSDFLEDKFTDVAESPGTFLGKRNDVSYGDYLKLKLKLKAQEKLWNEGIDIVKAIKPYDEKLNKDNRQGGREVSQRISSNFNEYFNRVSEQNKKPSLSLEGIIRALPYAIEETRISDLNLITGGLQTGGKLASAFTDLGGLVKLLNLPELTKPESFQRAGRKIDYFFTVQEKLGKIQEEFLKGNQEKVTDINLEIASETIKLMDAQDSKSTRTAEAIAIRSEAMNLIERNKFLQQSQLTEVLDGFDKTFLTTAQVSSTVKLITSALAFIAPGKQAVRTFADKADAVNALLFNALQFSYKEDVRKQYELLKAYSNRNQQIISGLSSSIDFSAQEVGQYLTKTRTDVVTRRPDGTIAVSINGVVFPP